MLLRKPGFSVTVILTLALAVGANLAVFQLLHAVLLARLPVERPAELYSLHAVKSPFDKQWLFSYPAYVRMREASAPKYPVIARSGFGSGVFRAGQGDSAEAGFQLVSGNFFGALGLQAAAGRLFVPSDDDDLQGETPVVLRAPFARAKFGSWAAAIGARAVLNRVPVVVVGVAPESFSGVVQGRAPDLWMPLSAQSTGRFGTWFDSLGPGDDHDLGRPYRNQASIFWLWAIARVPAGSLAQAQSAWTEAIQPDLQLIAGAPVSAQLPPPERAGILHAQVALVSAAGGEGSLSKTYERPLSLMMAMAAMVFLAGCLNLANLQFARLAARRREIAVRLALGASRWRVLRELCADDLLLLAIGGISAFAVCGSASALLLRWASGRDSLIPLNIQYGPALFLVGAAMLAMAMLCFSVLPAWHATRLAAGSWIQTAMQTAVGGIAAGGRRGGQWSSALLSAQVSLSLLLLSMAALFAQTLRNLSHVDAGLDRQHVLSVHLDLASDGLDNEDNAAQNSRILSALRALPSVKGAAVQMCRMPGCQWNTAIHVAGRPELPEAQLHGEENHVSTGYFATLGIPLLRGRDFAEGDTQATRQVVILNKTFAHKLFGDDDPIGHSVGYAVGAGDHSFTVIGEVADAHVDGLREPAPPVAYMSIDQTPTRAGTIEVRSLIAPSAIAGEVRNTLDHVDAALPIEEIVPLDTEFADGLGTEKLLARLTTVFGALTLALAAIGFYGLLSFQVTRRTSEIGIRMALGATHAQVSGMFVSQTLRILLLGIVPGVVLAELAARAARTLLFGVSETDPRALLVAVTVLLCCGIAATLIPARRAATVDPMRALRSE